MESGLSRIQRPKTSSRGQRCATLTDLVPVEADKLSNCRRHQRGSKSTSGWKFYARVTTACSSSSSSLRLTTSSRHEYAGLLLSLLILSDCLDYRESYRE